MADQVLVLQVRDATTTRRDIGVETSTSGNWAARVLDPDSVAALADILAELQGGIAVTSNGLTDAQLRAAPVPISGTVSVTGLQTDALTDTELRASPVPVSFTATDLDIRDLVFATDKVDVSGSSISVSNFPATFAVTQSTSPWVVSATDLDIRNLVFADDKVDASGSSVSVSNFPATQPVSGTVTIQDGGNVITVDATDFDIRNLTFATDKVDASGSDIDVVTIVAPNFPASLGQKTMVNSLPVVLPSDQDVTIAGDVNVSGMSGLVDSTNSYEGTVANMASTTGGVIDVSDYGSTSVALFTDSNLAGQFVSVNWFSDAVGTDLVAFESWQLTGQPAGSLLVPVLAPYIKVFYTNETGATRTIDFSVMHHPGVVSGVTAAAMVSTHTRPMAHQSKLVEALPAGTNNIGDVDVLSLPALPAGTNTIGKLAANSGVDIGDVDVTSIAAGTNEIGRVGSKSFNGVLKDDSGDDVTVKTAVIGPFTAAGSGNTTIVAANATKRIRVIGIYFAVRDAANHIANFTDGAGGASLFGILVLNGNISHSFTAPDGGFLCQTTVNTALVFNLSQNVDEAVGRVVYIEVD